MRKFCKVNIQKSNKLAVDENKQKDRLQCSSKGDLEIISTSCPIVVLHIVNL